MTPAERIYAAFPSEKQPHRAIRFNLLRVLHAGSNVETALHLLSDYIDGMIDNPPWSLWSRPDEVADLRAKLRALDYELERAQSALDAAKPLWTALTEKEQEDVVNLRQDREQGTAAIPPSDEAPF